MPRQNAAPAILEATKDCLVSGHGDFEMSDVARTAGVSEGLAYHYYGSKAGLVASVIKDFYTRYNEVFNARYDGNIPWAVREKDRLAKTIAFLYSDPLAPIVFGKLNQIPQSDIAELTGQDEIMQLAIKNIRGGIKRGQISDQINPNIAGAAIDGALRSAVSYALTSRKRPSPERLTEQLWGLISGALGRID